MSNRRGPATIMSASEAEESLPHVCLYLLAGRAQAVFPSSTRAAPSSYVKFLRRGQIPQVDVPRFTVTVNWEQWENAVVPVLEDERWKVRTPMVKARLASGDADGLVADIGADLRLSFQAAGYQ